MKWNESMMSDKWVISSKWKEDDNVHNVHTGFCIWHEKKPQPLPALFLRVGILGFESSHIARRGVLVDISPSFNAFTFSVLVKPLLVWSGVFRCVRQSAHRSALDRFLQNSPLGMWRFHFRNWSQRLSCRDVGGGDHISGSGMLFGEGLYVRVIGVDESQNPTSQFFGSNEKHNNSNKNTPSHQKQLAPSRQWWSSPVWISLPRHQEISSPQASSAPHEIVCNLFFSWDRNGNKGHEQIFSWQK